MWAMALCLTGCGDPNAVRVRLASHESRDNPAPVLQMEAQVAGPLSNLRYKWFAVAGQCEPQQSDRPETLFRFAQGVREDQVTVEVWRGDQMVATDREKVVFDMDQTKLAVQSSGSPVIVITNIPPAEVGGEKSHADIGGTVLGGSISNCAVVIYARAYGSWYIQPNAGQVLPISPGNIWSSWTHTGAKYAALLVDRGFEPMDRTDLLPEVKGPVLACTVVDGVRTAGSTNLPPDEKR